LFYQKRTSEIETNCPREVATVCLQVTTVPARQEHAVSGDWKQARITVSCSFNMAKHEEMLKYAL
jgi:hypothetical protein